MIALRPGAAPIDRMARWSTPEGADLRARLLDHLRRGRALFTFDDPAIDLSGIDLRGERLAGASLPGARLDHARLDGADLAGAHLNGAILRGAHLAGANLAGADLVGADLSIAILARANLRLARLVRARLDGAILQAADLVGADLRGASLPHCDFEDAWLLGIRMDHPPAPRPGSVAADCARNGFPTFTDAMRGYLDLLGGIRPAMFQVLDACLLVAADRESEVRAMLRQPDWRPVLVGLAAVVAGAASPPLIDETWSLFDRGTWVAPQVAATLLLVDSHFEARAAERLLAAMAAWKPTKGLSSLAAAYRALDAPAPAVRARLDALDREGSIDCEFAVALTEKWLTVTVRSALDHIRSKWARVPAPRP